VLAEGNKALVRRYIDEVWNGRRPAAPFFTPHYQRHLTATSPTLTGAQQQQRIWDFQSAFPDLHFTIEDLFAEGDRVVFRATMRGTHSGMFQGIAPTGRQAAVTVLDIVRLERDEFAEQWGGPDLFDLLQQLGAVVSAGVSEA
jgi:predicted ester cyclase